MYFEGIKGLIVEIYKVFRDKRFWYSVKYCLWVIIDKLRGVDYIKNAGYNKTGLDPKVSLVYQATRDTKILKQILESIGIQSTDCIIDLGCGKGYMLKYFSRFPFGKIGGVEFSTYLVEIAQDNIRKDKLSKCVVYCEDAACFTEYDEYNMIYMFAPFRECVMKEVMMRIRESLERKHRTIYIIYKIPLCHRIIMESGLFDSIYDVEGKTEKYRIYKSKG